MPPAFIEITVGLRSQPTYQVIAVDAIFNVFPALPEPFPGIPALPESAYGHKSTYFDHDSWRFTDTFNFGSHDFSRVQMPGVVSESITKEQYIEAWNAFREANTKPLQKAWEDAHDFQCSIEFRPEFKLQPLNVLDTYERISRLLLRD